MKDKALTEDPPAHGQPDGGGGGDGEMGRGEGQREDWNRCSVIPAERETDLCCLGNLHRPL